MRSFLIILLAGLLGACSSDDEKNEAALANNLEVSKNEVKLTNVGGPFTINVTATGDWTAKVTESNSSWLTLSKKVEMETAIFVYSSLKTQMTRSVKVRLRLL